MTEPSPNIGNARGTPMPTYRSGHQHNWIDTTAINSPDYQFECADCGLFKVEPREKWPLYVDYYYLP